MAEKRIYYNPMEDYESRLGMPKYTPVGVQMWWAEEPNKGWVQPEFDFDGSRVTDGKYSFKVATRHAPHSCHGSVALSVKPNSKIRFAVNMAGLSLDHDGSKGGLGVHVGYSLEAGGDIFWGEWVSQQQGWDGAWVEMGGSFTALTSYIGIHFGGQCDYPVDNNVWWVDRLQVWAEEMESGDDLRDVIVAGLQRIIAACQQTLDDLKE